MSEPDRRLRICCGDLAATHAVAAALVPHLRGGDVVLLVGDLGTGKTAFTQGLARAAGVDEAVTSPTFTLMRPYPTALGLDLLHVDVYRLDTEAEIADLGLGELLEEGAFAVIEWGERAAAVVGADHLEVRIARTPGRAGRAGGPGAPDRAGRAGDPGAPDPDTARHIELRPSGPSWIDRWPTVQGALLAAGLASPAR